MDLRKPKEGFFKQAGKKIGASGDIIGRYERDEVKPSIEVVSKIADEPEVSMDYLMGRKDLELNIAIIIRVVEIQTSMVKIKCMSSTNWTASCKKPELKELLPNKKSLNFCPGFHNLILF